METHNCSNCGSLPASEFHFRSTKSNKLQNICKKCRSEYGKQYHASHREEFRKYNRIREAKTREINRINALEYLTKHPCIDCGETDPIVLDFDHKDSESKFLGVCQLIGSRYTWKTILAEISKCSVRCANCHRRRTAKQFNHFRYRLSNSDAT